MLKAWIRSDSRCRAHCWERCQMPTPCNLGRWTYSWVQPHTIMHQESIMSTRNGIGNWTEIGYENYWISSEYHGNIMLITCKIQYSSRGVMPQNQKCKKHAKNIICHLSAAYWLLSSATRFDAPNTSNASRSAGPHSPPAGATKKETQRQVSFPNAVAK